MMRRRGSMANLNFFAAEADQQAFLEFLFASTDVRVFESYSEPDRDLREFCSVEALRSAFNLGTDANGNGTAILLQLWSPSVMDELKVTRFALDPIACAGWTFRHRIDGGALMQLYLGGVCGRVVTHSHFGHFSQKAHKSGTWTTASIGSRSRRYRIESSTTCAGEWPSQKFRVAPCCRKI